MKKMLLVLFLQFLQITTTYQSCQPRDDVFGHYTCINGQKQCLKDWSNITRNCLDFCSIQSPNRKDCGFHGINDQQCIAKGCCWKENHEQQKDIPWCFHGQYVAPPPTSTPVTTTLKYPSSNTEALRLSTSVIKATSSITSRREPATPTISSSSEIKATNSILVASSTSSTSGIKKPSSTTKASTSSTAVRKLESSPSSHVQPSSSPSTTSTKLPKLTSTKLTSTSSTIIRPSLTNSMNIHRTTSTVESSSRSTKIRQTSSTVKTLKSTSTKPIQSSTSVEAPVQSSSSTIGCYTQQLTSTITITKIIKTSCSNDFIRQTTQHIQHSSSTNTIQQQQNSCISTERLSNSGERIAGVERTPMLIIIVLGALLLFFMILSIVLFCKERRRKKRYERFESDRFDRNFKNPVFADRAMNVYD